MDQLVCKIENENYSNYQSESIIKEEIMLPDDTECFDDVMSNTVNNNIQPQEIPFGNKLQKIEQICNQDQAIKNQNNSDEEIDVVNVDIKSEKLFVEAYKNRKNLRNTGQNNFEKHNSDNKLTKIDHRSIKTKENATSYEKSLLLDVVCDNSDELPTLKRTREIKNSQVEINDNIKENITPHKKKCQISQKQTTLLNFLKTASSDSNTQSLVTNNSPKAVVNKDASKTTSKTFEVKTVVRRKKLSTEFKCPKCGIKMKKKGNMLRHKERCGTLFECQKCGKKLKKKDKLQQHIKSCGITVQHLKCKFCSFKTKCHYYMVKHIEKVHKDVKPEDYADIMKQIVKKGEKIKASFLNSPAAAEATTIPKTNEYKKLIQFFCTSCGETREYVDDMQKADCQKCGNATLLQCIKCTKRFPTKASIFRHMGNKCAAEKRFQCADCEYSSTAKGNLEDHIRRRHIVVAPKDYEKCSKCYRRYKYRIERIKHEKVCGQAEVLQCQLCPFTCTLSKTFKKHMQDHILHPTTDDATTSVAADNSNIKVSDGKPLNKTVELKLEKLTKAYCSKCKKSVKYVKHVPQRCGKCETKLTYPCSTCGKIYLKFYKLRVHVLGNHLDDKLKKSQQCLACGKKFPLFEYLRVHQYHCLKKPHLQCAHCPFMTKYRRNMEKHLQRKHGEVKKVDKPRAIGAPKLFPCTQCDKSYTFSQSLNKHREFYCGKQPSIACDHCSFKAYVKESLINHLKGMHNHLFIDQELRCRHCGKDSINVYTHNTHVANCKFK